MVIFKLHLHVDVNWLSYIKLHIRFKLHLHGPFYIYMVTIIRILPFSTYLAFHLLTPHHHIIVILYDLMHHRTSITFDDYFKFNCNSTRSHSRTLITKYYYYYYQFFQRWVTQKAILPVQGDPQHRTYIHMYNYTQTNTKGI